MHLEPGGVRQVGAVARAMSAVGVAAGAPDVGAGSDEGHAFAVSLGGLLTIVALRS